MQFHQIYLNTELNSKICYTSMYNPIYCLNCDLSGSCRGHVAAAGLYSWTSVTHSSKWRSDGMAIQTTYRVASCSGKAVRMRLLQLMNVGQSLQTSPISTINLMYQQSSESIEAGFLNVVYN